MNTQRILALVFVIVLSATTVFAVSYSATDNVTDNINITGGNSISGVFDLATLLPQNQYSSPFDIQNGSIVFNFSVPTTTSAESLSVTIDGITKSWSAPGSATYGNVQTGWGWYSYSYSCGWWSTCSSSYSYPIYSYQQTGYNYGGSGSLTFNFDATTNQTILNDLSTDGKVAYTATFFGGTTDFINAALTADVDTNPVPEPGTMALLGLGMAGLAVYGKRRKQNIEV